MNDLMTKSFVNYVILKKQAMADLQADDEGVVDLEVGGLTRAEEENMTHFFEDISVIQSEMDDVSSLLDDLQCLNEETKSVHSAKVLRGVRDRMDSDMVAILRKAKAIKSQLEGLDSSNVANRSVSPSFGEGSPVDRTRMSVTSGVRTKLREMMKGFQSLRERILFEHKEGLKRRNYNATGEVASQEIVDKMLRGGSLQVGLTEKNDNALDLEVLERQKAVTDIQRSLMQLHQIFLDMAIIVEEQEEPLNNIEENVVRAKDYISGGTDRLASANALKKRKVKCTYLVLALVVMVILVCLIPIITAS